MIKLSIIVPVFNAEKYVRSCLKSIFMQGLDESEFEVVIVNDGSTDKSIVVLSDVINSHSNIIVINQKNYGLSIARNVGLSNSTGDYIVFMDSDDMLIPYHFSTLLDIALKFKPDLLISDYLNMTDDEIDNIMDNRDSLAQDVVQWKGGGKDFFVQKYDGDGFVWRCMFNREYLIDMGLSFYPGISFQDMPYIWECILNAKSLYKVNLKTYIYRQHNMAVTKNVTRKTLKDLGISISLLQKIKSKYSFSSRINSRMNDVIFSKFLVFCWYIIKNRYLFGIRNEIILEFKQQNPVISFNNGLKQRTITILFKLVPSFSLYIRRKVDIFINQYKNISYDKA